MHKKDELLTSRERSKICLGRMLFWYFVSVYFGINFDSCPHSLRIAPARRYWFSLSEERNAASEDNLILHFCTTGLLEKIHATVTSWNHWIMRSRDFEKQLNKRGHSFFDSRFSHNFSMILVWHQPQIVNMKYWWALLSVFLYIIMIHHGIDMYVYIYM